MEKFHFFEKTFLTSKEEEKHLELLRDLWKDGFEKNKDALCAGIREGLKPTASQLKSILQRENLEVEEIGFDMNVHRSGEATVLVVHYLFRTHNLWFRLYRPGDNSFSTIPLHDLHNISSTSQDIRDYGHFRASLIAGDVAREGIPKDMKSAIGEIKRGLSHIDEEFNKLY